MSKAINLYGDGKAAKRIVRVLIKMLVRGIGQKIKKGLFDGNQ